MTTELSCAAESGWEFLVYAKEGPGVGLNLQCGRTSKDTAGMQPGKQPNHNCQLGRNAASHT